MLMRELVLVLELMMCGDGAEMTCTAAHEVAASIHAVIITPTPLARLNWTDSGVVWRSATACPSYSSTDTDADADAGTGTATAAGVMIDIVRGRIMRRVRVSV